MDWESLPRQIVTSLVDDEGEVIDLEHAAEVNHWAALAAHDHAHFSKDESASHGHIIPGLALNDPRANDSHCQADERGEEDEEAYVGRKILTPLDISVSLNRLLLLCGLLLLHH